MSNSSTILVSLASLGAYSYALYFMACDPNLRQMAAAVPKELLKYGLWKFLTIQSLLMQIMSSLLHLGACLTRSLETPRDFFFSALAYPIGNIVTCIFWAVWHIMGRELIFPAKFDEFFPSWLNHVIHSLSMPVNILLAILVRHKYSKNGAALTVVYLGCYTGLLLHIKQETGMFVYKYLETMNQNQLTIYFASTGMFAYMIYKSGQLLTSLMHSKPIHKTVMVEKQK